MGQSGGSNSVCPVEECGAWTPSPIRLCHRHWGYVPSNLRQMLFRAYNHGHGVETSRFERTLRAVAGFAHRGALFVEGPTGNAPGGPGTSDVFSPDWRPGRDVRRKAIARAARTGETFDEAAMAIAAAIRRGQEANTEHQRREASADRDRRQQMRQERRFVYPKPNSVRDFPAGGFETNRRRH